MKNVILCLFFPNTTIDYTVILIFQLKNNEGQQLRKVKNIYLVNFTIFKNVPL
jgi:hypothetical protein